MRMSIKSIKIKCFNYLFHKDFFIFKCFDCMTKIHTILVKCKCEIVSNVIILDSKSIKILNKIYARVELDTILRINKSNNVSNFEGYKQINLSFIVG